MKDLKLELWALVTEGKIIQTYDHEDVALEEASLHGAANPGDQFTVFHLASEALAHELLVKPKLKKLIEAMQRMQQSFHRSARSTTDARGAAENRAIAVVLGDVIRLAAELQAGEGERDKVPA